jgi:hypothetical protein
LADSITRFLQITRRRIPLDHSEDFARLWEAVRDAAKDVGANAWIFESAHVAGYFTEFVEWKGDSVNPAEAQLDELDSEFPPEESSVWTEATTI